MKKQQMFLAGSLGAFAPQILRWYNQVSLGIDDDLAQLAGRIFVTLLFLVLAGFIVVMWEARNLKEAFLVGLGVPSIILSAGADVGTILKPKEVHAQVITQDAHVVVSVRNVQGQPIGSFRITATDQAGKVVYTASKNEALLPAGRYTIAVSAKGYETESRQLTLTAKQNVSLDIMLREKSFGDRFFEGVQRPFEQRQAPY